VERGYRTPLITRPDSTPSHVFSIYQKTKYFSGRRQLQGKRACGVSPVIELQQAHGSTAFLSLSKALAHDSIYIHMCTLYKYTRCSRCSNELIQNAANSASKQKTYEGAYTKLLLQAHCSQVSQRARASLISAKTHHGVGDGGRERVSWIEPNFNVSECAY